MQDELAVQDEPPSLTDFIALAIRIDNRLREQLSPLIPQLIYLYIPLFPQPLPLWSRSIWGEHSGPQRWGSAYIVASRANILTSVLVD